MLKKIPKHISDFIGGLDLKPIYEVMKLSVDERLNYAALGDHIELAGILFKGFCLLGLKEEMGHGNYMAALAKRGLSKDEAWRARNLAVLSMRVTEAEFAALRNLSPTKLSVIAKWEDHEISAFCKGKEVKGITYDDAVEMPTRELDRRLKGAQPSNNELQQELDKEIVARKKAEEKARLLTRKQNEPEGFLYPESVERVRIEASVLASQANRCLDDMEQFMTALTQATDLSHKKEQQAAEFSAGASTLYVNLKSVYSKAAYLLSWFKETIGEDYMPENPEDTPLLTTEEAMKVHNMREVMLLEYEMEKLVRENARKNKRRQKRKAK